MSHGGHDYAARSLSTTSDSAADGGGSLRAGLIGFGAPEIAIGSFRITLAWACSVAECVSRTPANAIIMSYSCDHGLSRVP